LETIDRDIAGKIFKKANIFDAVCRPSRHGDRRLTRGGQGARRRFVDFRGFPDGMNTGISMTDTSGKNRIPCHDCQMS
jgi:hypothetical protein